MCANLNQKVNQDEKFLFCLAIHYFINFQLKKQAYAYIVSKTHYDIGNELYIRMLNFYMTYTYAYYQKSENLE